MARPTQYEEDFPARALTLCRQGATDEEIAADLGVCVRTLYRYANRYPEFSHALKIGKQAPDDRVERSLYARACGYETTDIKQRYEYREDEQGKEVRVLISEEVVTKQVGPDTTAGIFWLKNRRPDAWRDRKEFTGADGEPLMGQLSKLELAQRLASILTAGQIEAQNDEAA